MFLRIVGGVVVGIVGLAIADKLLTPIVASLGPKKCGSPSNPKSCLHPIDWADLMVDAANRLDKKAVPPYCPQKEV